MTAYEASVPDNFFNDFGCLNCDGLGCLSCKHKTKKMNPKKNKTKDKGIGLSIYKPIPSVITPSTATTNTTKQGWYDKTLDAVLTYYKNKNERDVAIAQAGGQIPSMTTPFERLTQEQTMSTTRGQLSAVGSAFGETAENLADFLQKNFVVVGAIVIGILLFMRDPKKSK